MSMHTFSSGPLKAPLGTVFDALNVRFYIDPQTGEPHIYNQAFRKLKSKRCWGRPGRIGPAPKGRE